MNGPDAAGGTKFGTRERAESALVFSLQLEAFALLCYVAFISLWTTRERTKGVKKSPVPIPHLEGNPRTDPEVASPHRFAWRSPAPAARSRSAGPRSERFTLNGSVRCTEPLRAGRPSAPLRLTRRSLGSGSRSGPHSSSSSHSRSGSPEAPSAAATRLLRVSVPPSGLRLRTTSNDARKARHPRRAVRRRPGGATGAQKQDAWVSPKGARSGLGSRTHRKKGEGQQVSYVYKSQLEPLPSINTGSFCLPAWSCISLRHTTEGLLLKSTQSGSQGVTLGWTEGEYL